MRSSEIRVCLLALGLALTGCNTQPGEPGDAVQIVKNGGDGQTAIAGAAIPLAITVREGGKPMADQSVRFHIPYGAGYLSDTVTTTNGAGKASTLWFLGTRPGEQRIEVRVAGARAEFRATATTPAPGRTYFGRNDYVEYQPGELPVILAAPHAGTIKPNEIPDRTYGVKTQDGYSGSLTRAIADALQDLTGKRPHIIIMRLHRAKLDPNREIVEAAQGDTLAERAWNEHHLWIETARKLVAEEYGRGLFLDIHSHGNKIPRLELGYLLSKNELALGDELFNQPAIAQKSSIRTLATRSGRTLAELIRGEQSFGEMMVRRGYPAVPSASDPDPTGTAYFTGGYSTLRHSSRDGGPIDGIQIEHNSQVRNTAAVRAAYSRALAQTIVEYLELYMGLKLVD